MLGPIPKPAQVRVEHDVPGTRQMILLALQLRAGGVVRRVDKAVHEHHARVRTGCHGLMQDRRDRQTVTRVRGRVARVDGVGR